MAFQARYRFFGGSLIQKGPYTVKSGETIVQGMLCKLTSGEVEPADSGDATFAGWAVSDAAAADTDLYLYEIDTVMADPADTNARIEGAALDLASGSNAVTTHSNDDLVVVEASSATQETLVMIHPAKNIFFVAT